MTSRLGSRWLISVLRLGPSRDAGPLVRHFPRRLGEQLEKLLPGAPLGFYVKGGQLVHPEGPLPEAATVGHVEAAWLEGDRLLATVQLAAHAERVRRGLLALERDGRLYEQAVSLHMFDPELEPRGGVAGREVVVLWAVAGVHSLDFVARAAAESAHVLRSIPEPMAAVVS